MLCVCFHAVKLPKPLANRDFVTQRSWQDNGLEKLIVNHSVSHKASAVWNSTADSDTVRCMKCFSNAV